MRALAVASLLTGCWGNAATDLSGTYHVSSHVASACASDTSVAMPAAYLRMYSANGYAMDVCSSVDAASCGRVGEFPHPIDDGWSRSDELFVLFGETAQCELQSVDGSAVLDDDTLTVEITTRSQTFADGTPACLGDETYYRDLPCTSHVLITATRLIVQP